MVRIVGPIGECFVITAIAATHSGYTARAQFVPGHIFTAGGSDTHCKVYRDGFVNETDPENGTYRLFASLPPNTCPGLASLAMAPDGKHLRVAALNWGAILEFDAHGNWEVVIDGSDGVDPAANWNSITYDRQGNFYLSNYYALDEKVVKFPADGGPKQVLAYSDNNGVQVFSPYGLSVGPSGEVYVADEERLIRIGGDGKVTLFDEQPFFIYSVLVDDFGFVHAQTGIWYRYELGDATSRQILAGCGGDGSNLEICDSEAIVLSPDKTRIYTNRFDHSTHISSLISVDPHDGSYETVTGGVGTTLAVVPLRSDVDGDGDTDIFDFEWLIGCMEGPNAGTGPACELADMDADGDVDLFDVRYFMLGHTAFQH